MEEDIEDVDMNECASCWTSPLTFDKSIIRDVDSELLTKRRCSGRNRRCGPSNSSNDDGGRNKGLFRGIL
ncbi:15282_t:CDS:2 [Funneliformis mosseae]|uniref:15282_t:CDS:1 n=1 Tax=Funneliformis mosseae TaxID=27381 RepID=A0A9N9DL41_FUNMO|nr:15282_t:CDS:2 [Funneliformis mosseae]